jgi:tRNA(fMet)-specific endonuclease VapC
MGTIVDTTVFVDLERTGGRRPEALVGERLAARLGQDDEVGIAAITASELLHGVHRASAEHRGRRQAFVETVLAAIPVLDFDLLAARAHARLWADLVTAGRHVGPHDRLVAATAISLGWRVATGNMRHFRRIAGLEVIELG